MKTSQERYDEIQKEIWQISDSYTNIIKDKKCLDLNDKEKRHIEFLHFRVNGLIKELNTMNLEDIKIPLVYRSMVNKLRRDMFCLLGSDYKKENEENQNYLV